jgi:hypothetical protein
MTTDGSFERPQAAASRLCLNLIKGLGGLKPRTRRMLPGLLRKLAPCGQRSSGDPTSAFLLLRQTVCIGGAARAVGRALW